MISYNVTQRMHELGVRVALGAQARDVARLVIGEALGIIVIGVVLGVVAALAGGRFVAALLYDVSPRDPMVLVSVSVILLVVAVGASLAPAWRAMRVQPIVALQAE